MPVQTVFGDIAVHVVESKGIRLLLSDSLRYRQRIRRTPAKFVELRRHGTPGVRHVQSLAAVERRRRAGAAGELPLALRRQVEVDESVRQLPRLPEQRGSRRGRRPRSPRPGAFPLPSRPE